MALSSTGGSGDVSVGLSEIADPTPLDLSTSPATVDGEQTVYGDRHFFSFEAEAGDLLKFTVSIPAGSMFNASLKLRGPDSDPFHQGFNLFDVVMSVQEINPIDASNPFSVEESGTYTLEVERGGSSGPIPEALGAWSLSVLTPDPATAIAVGDTVSESLDLPGEIDLYTFTATAGQTVDITTDGLDADVQQVNWSLTAPDDIELFDVPLFDDPGAVVLPQTGTYTLLVGSDNDSGTGGYSFTIVNAP